MFDHASSFIDEKKSQAPTLFQIIQQSSLPAHEKSVHRLAQEGFTILIGGSETTARVLTLIAYHLLAKREVLVRLMEELMEAMPDVHTAASVKALRELPWLVRTIRLRNLHPVLYRI
jgi:cytochrome P450